VCGIAGIVELGRASLGDALGASVAAMTAAVAHRGPDDEGSYVDDASGVALGHRRLAVLDLSPSGHQPMISHSGRFVLVFNGEIYNFRALRRRLESEGVVFAGTGDTEALLAGWERWGGDRLLHELNGMFALAVWDTRERTLVLARDRLGEKPLCWTRVGGVLAFASEMSALRHVPGFRPTVDHDVVAQMLRWGFVPGEEAAWSGVRKLPPGGLLTVRDGQVSVRRWWDLAAVAAAAAADRTRVRPDDEVVAQTGELLADAVALRLESDVPLGTFLSGGVDSSLVTALVAAAGGDVRTFTVGMAGRTDLDESAAAAGVADHLGTSHTALTLEPADVLAAVPELAQVYDEPFADPSGLAVLLLSRLTRSQVTVALTGDGGDEVFAGYNRYAAAQRVLAAGGRLPAGAGRLAGRAATAVPLAVWQRASGPLGRVPGLRGVPQLATKVHRAGAVLTAGSLGRSWTELATVWATPPVLAGSGTPGAAPGDDLRDLVLRDQQVTLPDDMLVKVDRASMSVALETRVPLLDHRLVEWSWSLPDDVLIRDGRGKWVLRELLRRHVPDALVDRPKLGFDPPVGVWLCGPLREWAGDLLSPESLARHGVVDPVPVRQAWAEHQRGRADHTYRLWAVLMLESWLDRQQATA
jgi:asparagine synthase (glutamine-hydrolysing)